MCHKYIFVRSIKTEERKMLKRASDIIKRFFQDGKMGLDDIGRSGDKVYISDNYVLKISRDITRLTREKDKLLWLKNRLPVAKVLGFATDKDGNVLLLQSRVKGFNICNKEIIKNPDKVCKLLADAIKMLKNNELLLDCPFNADECEGVDFVHGDFCLPNIMTDGEKITGFVDLENCGKGDKDYDYSWLIWSLCYNLDTKEYVQTLLNYAQIEFDKDKFYKYIPKENIEMIE